MRVPGSDERARDGGDAMRRRRIVVGDDDHLRALDAGVLQRQLLAGVAANHRQAFRFGLVRAAGTERGDDVRHPRAVQHAHQLTRGVAVAGDDHVVLQRRRVRLGQRLRHHRLRVDDRLTLLDLLRERAPTLVRNGVATISSTVAAMKACDPASPMPAGDSPTSRPARSSTNENSPTCASISAAAAAIGAS